MISILFAILALSILSMMMCMMEMPARAWAKVATVVKRER